jgi:Flp pilus assembly protein TadG
MTTTQETNMTTTHQRSEPGQVLVIVAVGFIALVAMVGLVIDGGFAWGKQRDTQNAADAIAKAGAGVLAENLAGVDPQRTDADVRTAVDAAVLANDVDLDGAYYTNFDGDMLTNGGAATNNESAAAEVGQGPWPAGTAGVRAVARQEFDTHLMSVVGFHTMTAINDAVARAGWQSSVCEAAAGCYVLPITIPVNVLACDGTNQPAFQTTADGDKIFWSLADDAGAPVSIPLCQNSPGNVGWLDWTPQSGTPGCSGTGTAEIECVIDDPRNPYMQWPGWYKITSTGNPNSPGVESALHAYDGAAVMIPQFDITCSATPTGPGIDGCQPASAVGGTGANQWYHLAGMSTLRLCGPTVPGCAAAGFDHGVYITGNNQTPCNTGNGATACIAGKFEILSVEGEVSANPPPNVGTANVGVQLIH